MAKRVLSVLVAAALLAMANAACASEAIFLEGAKEKFWRGLVNTFTGWVELPMQVVKGYKEGITDDPDNRIAGALFGIVDGVFHSAGRTVSGVFDLASFWTADPKNNRGVGFPLDADYAWQDGVPYDYFNPDFEEAALNPVWEKFARGVSSSMAGFVELPGQTMKGFEEGHPFLGITKGLWYWYSRQISGLQDLTGIFLPTPEETAGVAFEEEWPWDAMTD